MKHTELPWEVEGFCWTDHGGRYLSVISKDPYGEVIGESSVDEANAAFIVKAVNNHYQLLEALRLIESKTEDIIPPFRIMGADQLADIARKAIAEAE